MRRKEECLVASPIGIWGRSPHPQTPREQRVTRREECLVGPPLQLYYSQAGGPLTGSPRSWMQGEEERGVSGGTPLGLHYSQAGDPLVGSPLAAQQLQAQSDAVVPRHGQDAYKAS